MKKRLAPGILMALAAVALIVLAAPVLRAGDYHYGGSLLCQDCHVMHYSQSHGYSASGSGAYTALGTSGPYVYLLREDVNALCLTCHNATGDPDVLEDDGTGVNRHAGALNDDVNNSNGYYPATGHTLGSTEVAPGGTFVKSLASGGFNCTDCHEPHGDPAGADDVKGNDIETTYPTLGVYRNLNTEAGGASWGSVNVSYAVSTNDSNVDVFEENSKAYTVAAGAVNFNEPVDAKSGMSEWCKKCHTNFHGNTGGVLVGGGSGIQWLRHPSADADIGAVGGTHSNLSRFTGLGNRVKVMDPAGAWDGTGSELTPFCLSCHKAHGNKNAFGLIYMKGTGTVTEQGDDGTKATDLCQQCHKQGVLPPPTP